MSSKAALHSLLQRWYRETDDPMAERIETVLEVTRSAAGSSAEWRGAAERELMLAEELEGSLLA